MKRQVVILGAGFGGLELSTLLSERLADEVEVTLIDQNDAFTLGFSKLDILFNHQTRDAVRLPYRRLTKPSVAFRQETVLSIDPGRRQVATDAATYDSDFLVVALGADYDVAATPGFVEGGFEYYSVDGAERLRDELPWFRGGRRRGASSTPGADPCVVGGVGGGGADHGGAGHRVHQASSGLWHRPRGQGGAFQGP
jgi:sulfide:quinone oxidoreductase